MRKNGFGRVGSAAKIWIVALAVLASLVATASASTGGAPTPVGAPPPPSSPAGAPESVPSAGVLTLLAAETTPRKSFYFGYRSPRLTYTVGSTQPLNDLQIDVLNEAGEVVKTFFRNDVAPNVPNSIRWDGTTALSRPAPNGRYSFRIVPQAPTAPAPRRATRSTALSLSFAFYGYAFPILGQHEFGSSAGRYGAARSGHTHQGQDVMAPCGTPLVAARGGRVQYSEWDDAAGNYLVIDGKGTGYDFMYAHLLEPSALRVGDVVRTGQPIGLVGETGRASGCHLHFEMWGAPGWYEGGSPIDPYEVLQKWDAYS